MAASHMDTRFKSPYTQYPASDNRIRLDMEETFFRSVNNTIFNVNLRKV